MWVGEESALGDGLRRGTPGRIHARLHEALGRLIEAERRQLPLWSPVALGAGIAVYFGLHTEPRLSLLGAVLILAALVWHAARRRPVAVLAAAATLVLLGLFVAALRTQLAGGPVLERRTPPQMVTARVQMVEHMGPGYQRLTLAVEEMARLAPDKWPRRLRIAVRTGGDAVGPGDRVRVLAALWPPPAPSVPGEYDFARQLYFRGIGGLGVAVAPLERLDGNDGGPIPLRDRFLQGVEQLRLAISTRLKAALPQEQAAIADALVTGYRAALSDGINDAMRRAGLFHILSISGMHMSMVTGIVFFMLRAVLAAIEPLALRHPIKKWAAAAAILAALAYLFISGAEVPAERSFLMSALVLLAVICDRRAISLRMVAIAGFVVLVMEPESLLGPSFQMSFAAVVALVAAYEALRRHRPGSLLPGGIAGKILGYAAGLALSSIIAELAIAPASLYHFNEMPLLGLVANAVAVPVLGSLVMPGLILGVVLMPLGLEFAPLWVAGQGIEIILEVAFRVGAMATAVVRVPAVPLAAYLLIVSGGLWLCFWRSALRLLGLAFVAAGIVMAANARLPDILVEGGGDLVGIMGPDGRLWLSPGRASSFARERWTRMSGRAAARWEWTEPGAWKDRGLQQATLLPDGSRWLSCDGTGCLYRARPDLAVAIVNAPDAFMEDCAATRIVISSSHIPRWCGAEIVVGRREKRALGGQAIYIEEAPDGLSVIRRKTVAERRSGRPWGGAPHQ